MKITPVLLTLTAALFTGCATNGTHLYTGKPRPTAELASIKTFSDLEIDGQRRRNWPPEVYVLPGQHTLGTYGGKLGFAAVAGHQYERKTVSYASEAGGGALKFKSGAPADPVLRARLRMAAASLRGMMPVSHTFVVDRTAQKVVTSVPARARAEAEFTAHELGIPRSGLQ